ncbi:MAG: hypothetical protein AAF541_22535 [Pseudomonadota bacterium]
MIFLLMKMFFYIVVAAGIGGAAGWFLRNLQAQQTDEAAHRSVNDAKSKLPQLESLLRGRDEQIEKLKSKLDQYKEARQLAQNEVESLKKQLRKGEQELRRSQEALQALKFAEENRLSDDDFCAEPMDAEVRQSPAGEQNDQEFQQLQSRCTTLETALKRTKQECAEEVKTLEQQLLRKSEALDYEQEKVAELTREQRLHNKSLQVLHQQLEQARNQRMGARNSA